MKELFLREAVFPPMGERRGYPFSIPALKNVDKIIFSAPVTFLAGENGAGKSTLLEALAVALGLNPEGGSRNFLFSTRDTHSALGESIRLVRGPGARGMGSSCGRRAFTTPPPSWKNTTTEREIFWRGTGDPLMSAPMGRRF
ncbi:MAG: AAA family ATPase [Oscillospiraceae bacterium]|nr:AAA family ATPase [Oscillospiraceae bacterium]